MKKLPALRLTAPAGFVTVAELGRQLGVSRQRIHQLLKSRHVQVRKAVGGAVLIPTEAVPDLTIRLKAGRPKRQG